MSQSAHAIIATHTITEDATDAMTTGFPVLLRTTEEDLTELLGAAEGEREGRREGAV